MASDDFELNYYFRKDANFSPWITCSAAFFDYLKRYGEINIDHSNYEYALLENEFVIAVCIYSKTKGGLDHDELTLFVRSIVDDVVTFEVVTENPDEFWKKQTSEV